MCTDVYLVHSALLALALSVLIIDSGRPQLMWIRHLDLVVLCQRTKKKEQFFFNFEGFPDNNITINSLYLFLTINPAGGESTRYAKTIPREPGACRLLLFWLFPGRLSWRAASRVVIEFVQLFNCHIWQLT